MLLQYAPQVLVTDQPEGLDGHLALASDRARRHWKASLMSLFVGVPLGSRAHGREDGALPG